MYTRDNYLYEQINDACIFAILASKTGVWKRIKYPQGLSKF